MSIDYEARVAKGVALLDEKFPGWAEHIDVDTLMIASSNRCVTAQLAAWQSNDPDTDYRDGMNLLDLTVGECNDGSYTMHGFNAETEDAEGLPVGYLQHRAYDTLEAAWKRVISERQATAVTSA